MSQAKEITQEPWYNARFFFRSYEGESFARTCLTIRHQTIGELVTFPYSVCDTVDQVRLEVVIYLFLIFLAIMHILESEDLRTSSFLVTVIEDFLLASFSYHLYRQLSQVRINWFDP